MLRLLLFVVLSVPTAWGAVQPKPSAPRTNAPALSAEAELLLRRYRMDDRLDAKVEALRALGRLTEPRLAPILEREFEKLDSTDPEEARLAGVFLQAWAAQPSPVTLAYLIYEGLFHEDPVVVRDAADGIGRMPADARTLLSTGRAAAGRDPSDEIAVDLISRLMQKPELFFALEKVLVIWSGKPRPGQAATNHLAERPSPETFQAGTNFWRNWFEQHFRQKFEPVFEKSLPDQEDAAVHQFLSGDAGKGGDAVRGSRVFAALRCNDCHSGGPPGGSGKNLLGPDLKGVAQRLSRTELADALVYPSRKVAEPFKAVTVTLKDGIVLKGYVTEKSDDLIMLAGRAKLRRVERSMVAREEPHPESLMPARTLRHASWEEIRDLAAFLGSLTQGKTDR